MKYLFVLSLLFLFSCENAEMEKKENSGDATHLTCDITCPSCGYKHIEKMPTDQCVISYDCKHCEYTMTPQGDDCCVFCSYGNHECPSIQEKENE
jgi:hypothetical protein